MKNFITEGYGFWLQKFADSQKNTKLKRYAERLKEEIFKAHSINEAQNILQEYIEVNEYAVTDTAVFNNKILEWNNNLTTLESQLTAAKINLASVDPTLIAIAPLMTLVTDILENPQSLLHYTMPSFLILLSSTGLQDTLQYVASLDNVPKPVAPPKGSFAALEPLNKDHEACIQLIINTSAVIDTKNPQWEQANSLLQKLLLIHKDLMTASLTPVDEQSIFSYCVIS